MTTQLVLFLGLLVCFANAQVSNINFNPDEYTYALNQSIPGLSLWTAPSSRRILLTDRSPTVNQSFGIRIDAAKGEIESFQIIIDVGSNFSSVTVDVPSFPGFDPVIKKVATFTYSEYSAKNWITDKFVNITGPVTLNTSVPTVLWFNVYVPSDASSGIYNNTIILTVNNTNITIPLELTVWNWVMTKDVNFQGIYEGLPTGCSDSISCIDVWKKTYIDYRVTPEAIGWPSGITYSISWDSNSNPNKCQEIYDEPNESCQYSGGCQTTRYGLGQGTTWRGQTFSDPVGIGSGFNTIQTVKFVNNAQTRPSTFCGVSLPDDGIGSLSSPYNTEWKKFLTGIETYYKSKSYNGVNLLYNKTYYYTINEPQNDQDHKMAAFLCWLSKSAAPGLKVALSEEPKPEIAEASNCGCGYDIWIAHTHAYKNPYANCRQKKYPEESVWLYSLDNDNSYFSDLAFSPSEGQTALNHGMHYRIIPWVSYSLRVTGWGYYSMPSYWEGGSYPQPRMAAELLREGFEDYEYFYKINNGAYPASMEVTPLDKTIRSLGKCVTSWKNDPNLLKAIRYQLGSYITNRTNGQYATLPFYESVVNPRASYYLDFGEKTSNTTTWDNKEWTVVDWSNYNPRVGYGW
eukprot:TRINITY_DN4992_c0_g1_i1.p1 TRINITY_DN4992_c0_g1~~TRINITY_DN4992_c0_g1_i1.p1  ORF type:complete len:628 (+),score=102.83 TRINITY_DN4992_c0_g1_i1:22-1905(+)